MDNVTATINGTKLTLTIDLSAPTRPSSTGKTQIIASSGGNQKVGKLPAGGDVILGLNVYTK